MRAIILLLLAAQIHLAPAQVTVGNRFGWSFTKQHLDGAVQVPWSTQNDQNVLYQDLKLRSGGFAGAFTLDVPITGIFVLGADVGYSERGFRKPRTYMTHELFKSGHVSVSILPKVRLGTGVLRGEFFAGLDVARFLNLRHEYAGWFWILPYEETFTTHPFPERHKLMAPWEFSFVGGAGVVIGKGPAFFHLNARYVHGLSNIYSTPIMVSDLNGYTMGAGHMYNRSFIVSIGYSISLARQSWAKPDTQ